MSFRSLPPWTVVVPVQRRTAAKSRLRPTDDPADDPAEHAALAAALAQDTLTAVAATGARLVLVTGDADLADWAGALDSDEAVVVVADAGGGLGAALEAGLATVAAEKPVAVLLGDLPCLRPTDLTAALKACSAYPTAFVPDADGTGTVLLTGRRRDLVAPRFGPGSAQAHARSSIRLDLLLPRLRRDVDDEASLAQAVALGVGRHTEAALLRRTSPRTH